MSAPTGKQMPHVFAGLIALGLGAIILFAAHRVLIHLEHATIASTAPENFALKSQGLVFQRAAAHSPKVLPIYGSSELLRPSTGTGQHFLSHRANRFPTFARWRRRCESADHVAKSRRPRRGVAREKAGVLAFARLV